jgi:DNA-binding beta-propeller fold protein YncE
VIRLRDMRLMSTLWVGPGAHHITFSPDQRRAWIALGESAGSISIVDVSHPGRPRMVGHFRPGFPAHDLSFSPNGRQVWVSSAAGSEVVVFAARSRAELFRVPVGAPPQHLAFDGAYAYLTSGYGSVIEEVAAATGRVIRRTSAPYGSFELAAADGYVATASLLRGTLAIYTPTLKLLRIVQLAPATREVAISRP